MSYKVKPIYGSMKFGAKPSGYAVVDSDGIQVDKFIHADDAKREAAKRNAEKKTKRHFTGI